MIDIRPTQYGTVLRMDGTIDRAATARAERAKETDRLRAELADWAGFEPQTPAEWKDLARRRARALASECRQRSQDRRERTNTQSRWNM